MSLIFTFIYTTWQIFNDEVDSYKSWTLFLIFVFVLVLISGVVLLTHKKPERLPPKGSAVLGSTPAQRKGKGSKIGRSQVQDEEAGEDDAFVVGEEDERSPKTLWQVGDVSDDEDVHSGVPLQKPKQSSGRPGHEESGLMQTDHEETTGHRRSSSETLAQDPFQDETEQW
jgi:hypothetical protein